MLSILLLAGAPALQDAAAGTSAPVQHLVAVDVPAREAPRLWALDLDVAYFDAVAGRAEVIATPDEIAEIAASGLTHRVVVEDLARWYADRLAGPPDAAAGGPYGAGLTPPFGQGGMGGYYTFAQVASVLDQMTAAYPHLMTARTSIGQSIQGRDLWMVKISDDPQVDESEPEVRVDALHHAREPQGMQTTLWFMLYLLEEYGNDPLATYLVEERELYFVPCVNPDGYEYNRSIAPGGGGLWRKNRRDNGGGSFGVDLNRNYPYEWGYDNVGSSPDPSSELYRGTGPTSEPEIAAMVAFLSGRDFRTALSVHTYGDLWLAPWGYDELFPANAAEYDEVGALATEVNGYAYGPGSIILYLANGVTFDYDHGTHGSLGWTPEIGSSSDGFWPAQSRIVPLAEENLLAFQRTALAAGAWVRLLSLTVEDAGDGDGSFEAGEDVELSAAVRNSGQGSSGTVDVTLSSASPFVTVTTPSTAIGSLAGFSSGQTGTPLGMALHAATPAGTLVPFVVTVTYQGYSAEFPGEIVAGTEVTLASYDFEAAGDQGWGVGAPNDATTGIWTRVDPRGTAAQPEDDHSPGPGTRCWVTGQGSVGGAVGENDVDGGSTTLVSPVFDLDGLAGPRIRYWRWYSNDEGGAPSSDVFRVDLSNDGGVSWTPAEVVGPAGAEASGGWFEASLQVEDVLGEPADQVRIRFIASDLGDGSIVEAAVDDVEVTWFEGPACPAPASYCVAAPNSVGPGSLMSWSGSTDVTDDDFTLVATGAIPNQFGLFFYGPGQDQVPVGNGFICIGGGFFRLPAFQIDGAGQALFPVDFGNLPNGGEIANGTTMNFQFWYRDPMVGAGFNFSDGLNVEFCAD